MSRFRLPVVYLVWLALLLLVQTNLAPAQTLSLLTKFRWSSFNPRAQGTPADANRWSVPNGPVSLNVALNGTPVEYLHSLTFDPQNPNVVFAGGLQTHISTDGGTSWKKLPDFFDSQNTTLPITRCITNFVFSLAVSPADSRVIYAGTSGEGIFMSSDQGQTWSFRNQGLPPLHVCAPSDTRPGYSIRKLVINPKNPQIIHAALAPMNWDHDPGFGVYVSRDGGQSWNSANTGLTDPAVLSLALDPVSPDTLYAGTLHGRVFKTTNGGKNWAPAGGRVTDLEIQSLAVNPFNPQVVFAGSYVGEDAGSRGLFASSDGGTSWRHITTGLFYATVLSIAFHPNLPNLVALGGGGGVLISADGGQSWKTPTDNFPIKEGFLAAAYSVAFQPNSARLLAGVFGGGDQRKTGVVSLGFDPSVPIPDFALSTLNFPLHVKAGQKGRFTIDINRMARLSGDFKCWPSRLKGNVVVTPAEQTTGRNSVTFTYKLRKGIRPGTYPVFIIAQASSGLLKSCRADFVVED